MSEALSSHVILVTTRRNEFPRARCKQSAEARSRTYLETLSSRNITLKTGCGATSFDADCESLRSEWIVVSVVSTPSDGAGDGTRPALFVPQIGFSLSRQGVATVSLVSSSITSGSVSILTSITRTSLSIVDAARRNLRDSRARFSFLGTRCGPSAPKRTRISVVRVDVSSRLYLCVERQLPGEKQDPRVRVARVTRRRYL